MTQVMKARHGPIHPQTNKHIVFGVCQGDFRVGLDNSNKHTLGDANQPTQNKIKKSSLFHVKHFFMGKGVPNTYYVSRIV